MISAGTSDSRAVSAIVTIRTVEVGRTFLNESTALISVSDPPYMFSAVTETRPRTANTSAMAPNPPNSVSPADLSDAIVSNFSPAQAASAAPRHISQMPPSADPQYVQKTVRRTVTSGGRYRE